jgi:hypothetical protein
MTALNLNQYAGSPSRSTPPSRVYSMAPSAYWTAISSEIAADESGTKKPKVRRRTIRCVEGTCLFGGSVATEGCGRHWSTWWLHARLCRRVGRQYALRGVPSHMSSVRSWTCLIESGKRPLPAEYELVFPYGIDDQVCDAQRPPIAACFCVFHR